MCSTHYFPSYFVVNMRGFDFPSYLPLNMRGSIKGNIFVGNNEANCTRQHQGWHYHIHTTVQLWCVCGRHLMVIGSTMQVRQPKMRDNQNGGTTKKEGQPKMRHNQKGGTIKILTIDMSTLLDLIQNFKIVSHFVS